MQNWVKMAAKVTLAGYALIGPAAGLAQADMKTNGDHSILGGNQIVAPISVPLNLSGNAIAAGGSAAAASKTGASVVNNDTASDVLRTSGEKSILGGNQIVAPISVPANVCGNAVALLGKARAACLGWASVHNTGTTRMWTSGEKSIAGGIQAKVPVSVPANVCGNAAAVAGTAAGACKASATVHNGSSMSGNGRIAQAAQDARRDVAPEPGGDPLSSLSGLANGSVPLAQGQTPLAGQGKQPLSLGSPLSQGSPVSGLAQSSPLGSVLGR